MTDSAIRVDNLSKLYPARSLRARHLGAVHQDHAPPHFHVRYGEQKALIGIQSLTLLQGRLSPRVFGLVMEWASVHQAELMHTWDQARGQAELTRIKPLE